MYCPHCTTVNLLMTERQGIEIDYCPQCRGVWLDRGELDKLIEKSVNTMQSVAPSPQPQYQQPQYQQQQQPQYQQQQGYYHGKQKRPKSFWEEIFD